MSKQARGAWKVEGGPGYANTRGVNIKDDRGLVLAVAIGDVPELDAEANARLIAAAPDLLSIARRFVALDGGAWNVARHAAEKQELLAEACAAIAKAEAPR